MRSPIALLLLLATLLLGCPGPSPLPDAATTPLDAYDDLASDAFDTSIDLTDTSAENADVTEGGDAPRDTGDAGCEPGLTLPCTCVNGVAGTRVCHTSRVMGYCTCVTPGGDGGVTAPPPRLLRPLSGTRVTSQRPTLRWELPAGPALSTWAC